LGEANGERDVEQKKNKCHNQELKTGSFVHFLKQ
jgi:hypothetical protein